MVGRPLYSLPVAVDSKVPPVVDVEFNSELFHELEKEGLEELTHCGFVLVTGGLGERLGYNDIKIGLPIETFTSLPYIGYYIKKILSIQVGVKVGVHWQEAVQEPAVSTTPCHYDIREQQ